MMLHDPNYGDNQRGNPDANTNAESNIIGCFCILTTTRRLSWTSCGTFRSFSSFSRTVDIDPPVTTTNLLWIAGTINATVTWRSTSGLINQSVPTVTIGSFNAENCIGVLRATN